LALQKYAAVLQISKHLFQQPAIFDFLVGIAINLKGLEQINKLDVNRDINDIQLLALEQSIQSIPYNWPSDVVRFLDYEKLTFKSLICAIYYQTNSEGKIRLSRDPNATFADQVHFCKSPSGSDTIEFLSSSPRYNYWRKKE